MNRKYWLTLLAATSVGTSAFADVVIQAPWAPDVPTKTAEKNLYQILGFGSNAALNAALSGQEKWDTSIGNQLSSIIVEWAGNKGVNTFGIYDVKNKSNSKQIFDGNASAGATQVLTLSGSTIKIGAGNTLTLESGGTEFGFYLGGKEGTFYSEPSQNSGSDYLATLNWGGGTVLAWEDLPLTKSDKDYQDMVVKIAPVPEPRTLISGALLLLPFGASAIRILRRKV